MISFHHFSGQGEAGIKITKTTKNHTQPLRCPVGWPQAPSRNPDYRPIPTVPFEVLFFTSFISWNLILGSKDLMYFWFCERNMHI